jgi:hypothetical protein
MFKKEIKPLAEGMADSITKSINKLQHVEEKASRPADHAEGDVKPADISGEEEVKADGSAKKAPVRKGDKAVAEAYMDEKSCVGEMKKLHASSCSKTEMYKKVSEKYGCSEEKFEELYAQYCGEAYEEVQEDNSNDKSDDGEGMDKVQPKAVKKKFGDRKDKDIDNDGDEDSSDEYLHKRRKAISKALESKKPNASVDESAELEGLDEAKLMSDDDVAKMAAKKLGNKKNTDSYDQIAVIKGILNKSPKQKSLATDREFIDDVLNILFKKYKFRSNQKESAELEEGFSPKDIKMAIGIASDKRYAGGNMTGAVKAINKLKRGLSDHPQVSAVLKRQNEELDEVLDDPKAMDRYRSKAKYSSDRARNSATAKIVRGKGDYSGEKNTIRKREKGLDMVDRNAGRKLRKSLRREEVELDEAKPPQIQKGKAKGSISATGMRGKGNKKYDVMVGFDNGKFSFRITDEGGRFQTVGIKQASKMLGEENVNSLGLQELTSAEKKLINQMYDKKGNLTPIGKKVMDQGKAASKLSPKDIIKDKARRKEYTAFQKSKRNEELDEAKKSDYTIYHKTFSSAVQHAIDVSKKRGFEVDEDDWDRKVAMGPRKPGRGKTNSYTIDLMKSGKSVKNKLQMQVYYDEGRYELNMYIS